MSEPAEKHSTDSDDQLPPALAALFEESQLRALKNLSTQKHVSQAQLLREALDLLIAYHLARRIEPEFMRNIDDFMSKNRQLLKSMAR